jgi:hypothetical protein
VAYVDLGPLARRLRPQTGGLLGAGWQALRHGQVRRFWFGPASAAAVLILSRVAATGAGQAFLQRWAVMHGDESWWRTLAKVPLSVFAPTQLLPLGFAMLQVFVAFGVAQVVIGARRTLAIALAGHVLGSFSLRLWVLVGLPVGLPAWSLHLPDTGPSVAVIAVAAYLAVRLRVRWLAGFLVAYHVAEWFVLPGIAQREHLVGLAIGALTGLIAFHRAARLEARREARRTVAGRAVAGRAVAGRAVADRALADRALARPPQTMATLTSPRSLVR